MTIDAKEQATHVRRRATAADVARDVGVSRATVGFVLNNTPGQTISPPTRDKVLESARRLGYRPRAAAQALASGRSRLILLVLPDWPLDYSVRRYIEAASLVLDEAGYALVTWAKHESGHTRPLWEMLDPDAVVGFAPFADEDVESIRAHGIENIIPDPTDALEPPAERGPILQVQHLHELGHRNIAVATTADPRLAELAQRRAFSVAEAARGLDMISGEPVAVDAPGLNREALVRTWVSDGITAVVCYNDDIAAAVAGAAMRAGVAVPNELAIIGHDDSTLASLFVPALSSIRLDDARLGRLVAELALARVEGRTPLVDGLDDYESVVPRESTQGSSS